ncbi:MULTISPECIES: protein kinase domain-containing protein [unclassified Luteimonas]
MADELPTEERADFVARECAGDGALLAEIAWMRKAAASETTLHALRWEMAEPPELAGEQLCADAARDYRVLRRIGHGGMGVVYLAERQQDGFVQRVALKLLRRASGDSRVALERFQRERALLARLEHPGIARLVDGGLLSDGQPFLAIEYVEGEHIDAWCREHSPDLRRRLELFLQVCAAVEFAHSHLVIHRDLKPGNILVTAQGHTKLLDFGIARLLEAADGAPADATEFGQQALTIAYASPEQIKQTPLSVATDIYSLGVVLYQLVCGRQPFAHHVSSFDVTRAIVAGEVVPPSRQPAGGGGMERIPADIDAVVLKSMRPVAGERYTTVAALAADVRRFMAKRPVEARRSRMGYRARRFVQRNRWPIMAGTAIVATLTVGIAVSLSSLGQARVQQRLAEQRQGQLERITAFQRGVLESVDIDAMGYALAEAQRVAVQAALRDAPEQDDPAARLDAAFALVPATDIAREALDRYVVSHALERVQHDFADAPLLAADLRQSMARVLMGIGQYGSAVAELQQVLRKRRESLPDADPRIAAVLVDLGQAHYRRGDMDAAARSYAEAMTRRDRLLLDDPLRLAIESGNARLLAARGQQGEALAAQRALLERWSGALPAEDPALLELRRDEVHTLMQLGRRPEARTRMQALLPVYERSFGENAPATLAARLTFANLTNMLNDYEVSLREARAVAGERERSLGHDHPDTLQALALVGANRVRLAQAEPAFAEVEIVMRDLLQRQQRILGRDHPQRLASMSELVRLLAKQDQPAKVGQAIALQRQVMLARQRTLGESHLDSIVALGGLASLQANAGGMRDEAVRNARLALQRYERVVPGHRWISATWDVIGRAEFGAGNLQAARDAHHQALALRTEQGGLLDAHTVESASRLYVALFELDDRKSMEDLRTRYLEPVIALEPSTLNAAMLSIRDSALLAIEGLPD